MVVVIAAKPLRPAKRDLILRCSGQVVMAITAAHMMGSTKGFRTV